MKLLFFVMLMGLCYGAIAQSKSHSASSSSSSSSSSSPGAAATNSSNVSGSTQLIQGFHYLFHRHNHMIYKSAPKTNKTTSIFHYYKIKDLQTVKSTQITIKKTTYLQEVAPNDFRYKFRYDTAVTVGKADIPIVCLTNCLNDSVRINDTTIININTDSIRRYWNTSKRILTSVTQLDSGVVQLSFRSRQTEIYAQGEDQGGDKAFNVDKQTYKKDTVSYLAIPVLPTDSASNFQLQVKPKTLVSDPIYYFKLHYQLLQYGAVTIPYKYRSPINNRKIGGYSAPAQPGGATGDSISTPSESSASINVALYGGFKWGSTKLYYDQTKTHNNVAKMISVFVGPELITLSASNTLYNTNLNKNPSSILAISTGLAGSIEWQQFSFGLFSGVDFPLQHSSPWVYKNRIWIGFGIGFNLGMITNAVAQNQ